MGIYLSTPSTEVNSEAGQGCGLEFAAGEMQGWRKNMEDAHITYTGLGEDSQTHDPISVFGVFDGHGGKEVAKFVKLKYAEVLLSLPSFQQGDYEAALKQSFHKIDELLEDVQYDGLLKELRALPNPSDGALKRANSSSPVPINGARNGTTTTVVKKAKYDDDDDDSPLEHEKEEEGDHISDAEAIRLIRELLLGKRMNVENKQGGTTPSNILANDDEEDDEGNAAKKAEGKESKGEDKSEGKQAAKEGEELSKSMEKLSTNNDAANSQALVVVPSKEDEEESADSKNNKLKNKFDDDKYADHKERHLPTVPPTTTTTTTAVVHPPASIVGSNGQLICNLKDHRVLAGCTAIVCLLVGKHHLIVANAGDSRGVLSRAGTAFALSEDHKPQQEREYTRIQSAGGFVNAVGRINGNLNLSRSLGDLKYKSLKHLPPEAQIITAEPDIKVVEVKDEDEFFILGCDGIWDVLTNQEAVDFVRERMQMGKTLEEITHDVMKRCLADDPKKTQGIGGDNMTFLVVNLKPSAYYCQSPQRKAKNEDGDDDSIALSPMSDDGNPLNSTTSSEDAKDLSP